MNENNSQRRDYTLGKRIEGWAREAPKKFTPNLARRQHILSHPDGRYSSIFTTSIKPATQQFPSPAINIQLANGNGSAFQRIGSPDDLREFGHILAIWADELEAVWTVAVQDGARLESIQKEVETRAGMFKELIEQMNNEPEQYAGSYEEPNDNVR